MTPAIRLARRHGVQFELHEYDVESRADDEGYGEQAARALGVSAQRLFKTLLARLDDGSVVVAVLPTAETLDLKALASTRGAKRAEMAPAELAERRTGYVLGGISPIGQKRASPTVIDESAHDFERILVSAGRRGLQIELAPAALARLTDAEFAAITRR